MMKTLSLPFVTNKSLKQNNEHKASVEYRRIDNILILFTADGGKEKFQAMRQLQQNFQQDKKRVSFIYLLLKEEDRPDASLDDHMKILRKSDIGFLGEIKNESVRDMIKMEYDLIIHADLKTNIYTDLVLSMLHSRCKIGKHLDDRDKFYDFMIHTNNENNINIYLDEIYHYTKRF